MKKRAFSFLLLGAMFLTAAAQNPIISRQFTADPTARVFNGRIYLYPSHDVNPPASAQSTNKGGRDLNEWFCMEDYHVYSSDNLTDWTDHGMIITQNEVPWVRPDSYAMWAPDCVYKATRNADGSLGEGRYYFYFPAAPREGLGFGFGIGVATSDSPTGPFVCEPEPMKGVGGIDPCVFIDDDQQAYIYWSGMGIRGARLKENMKEIDPAFFTVMTPPQRPNAGEGKPEAAPDKANRPPMRVGGQAMEGLPDGFKEGPFVFKRGQHYYLTFPWVRNEGGTETLAYSMSDNPLGPWTFKGIIMAEHENGCWTNHHSIVEFKGQWYLFYHRNDYSPKNDKRRSTRIEPLSFNADGTIQEVHSTMRGAGINEATEQLQVDRYSAASNGVTTQYVDTLNPTQGWSATLPGKGSWLRYDGINFGCLEENAYVVASVKADANTELCLRQATDKRGGKGKVLARLKIVVQSEAGPFRRDLRGRWLTLAVPLESIPKGQGDLVVTCEGANASIDWVQFKNRPHYFSPATSAAAQPDSNGFIRRWMLLEPILKPIRSNTVFTDSYLHDHLGRTYFPQQQTILPKNGQKVKAEGQTLTWHALESQTFNVRLFRFADCLQKPTYGVLFCMVTVIDCPEEMTDVRLAVGSNGASRWWLNGEEVLLLSGDRRMVEDDAMSPRITLHRGRNVLRGMLINGPGLSDFCVRFIDGQGRPVTNFQIP